MVASRSFSSIAPSTRVHLSLGAGRHLPTLETARSCCSTTGYPSQRRKASTTSQPEPRTIFSGIQPTGVPHLGNYLGALREWVNIQDASPASTNLYYSIVDLHSLTSKSQTPQERRQSKRRGLASLLACGVSPERSTIFYQSSVPQHSELHWILSCDASMGALSRMTQWKTKTGSDEDVEALLHRTGDNPKSAERLKLGLFSYPVLQAADILLYHATHVPVGEDQVQHIEFSRTIANAFNHTYGGGSSNFDASETQKNVKEILIPPACIVSPAKRVMSLTEPQKKMSKSHESAKSRVLVTDSPEVILRKFRSALTDSIDGVTYDSQNRPGVSNLIDILSYLDTEGRTCQDIEKEFQTLQTSSGSALRLLKERVAAVVTECLAPVRGEYERLMGERNGKQVDEVAEIGAAKAEKKAEHTMSTVRRVTGLR